MDQLAGSFMFDAAVIDTTRLNDYIHFAILPFHLNLIPSH
jgi:hypothetical protein